MAQTVRTNRLVHRICQDYDGDLSVLNIPINRFHGACVGLLGGYLTSAQIVSFFSMSAGEQADWDALVARVTAKSNTINTNARDRCVEWIRTILVFYEDGGIPTFTTPDEVWSWITAI